MPGISAIYRKSLDPTSLRQSLEDLRHEPNYEARHLFNTADFALAFSGYGGYPRQYFEDEDAAVLLEGLVYNRSDSQIQTSLEAISRSHNYDYREPIRRFVDSSDGDFNILIYLKRLDRVLIFNDRWARLPSYYYSDTDMFVFSREMKFILRFIPSIAFDKVSIAQWLAFEYTLGDRTLVRDIHRAGPSSLFSTGTSNDVVQTSVERVLDTSFEQSPMVLSRAECVEKSKDLFLQSLHRRVTTIRGKGYEIAADVSGGYDTRAVFGGLCALKVDVHYSTLSLVTGDETECSAKLAALYDKHITRYIPAYDINVSDMSPIVYMTDCTVNGWTALSNYQAALERNRHSAANSVRLPGLGGEFIRHPYKARRHSKTLTDMVKRGYFVRCVRVEHACSMTNLDEESFYGQLTAYFDEYPEPTLRDRVKHFYFEYYNNLVNAGENMGRLHVWTAPPLWAKDLLSFEMQAIPPDYIGYGFFAEFMRAIDPRLLDAPIYGSSVRLNSRMSLRIHAIKDALRNQLIGIVRSNSHLHRLVRKAVVRRSRVRQSDVYEVIKHDIWSNHARLRILRPCLNEKEMREFIEDDDTTAVALYCLLTLILYFREIEARHADRITLS